MPKRTGKPQKRPDKGLDVAQNARRVVLESVGETETTVSISLVSRVMAAMGRKGGKIGGKRRMEMLRPEERSEMGRLAAQKRWASKTSKK
jgi:hypothetical protein